MAPNTVSLSYDTCVSRGSTALSAPRAHGAPSARNLQQHPCGWARASGLLPAPVAVETAAAAAIIICVIVLVVVVVVVVIIIIIIIIMIIIIRLIIIQRTAAWPLRLAPPALL